jgi:Ca2+-binding RTX toxin-like protein
MTHHAYVRVPRPQLTLIEPLEERALLSAVSLSRGGTLYVEGTRRSDAIVVRRNPANRGEIEVLHDGRSQTLAGRVKQVLVVTGAGDDTVLVDRRVSTAATLVGGAGDDSLSGGSGNDDVEGDGGDDSLVGGAGDDSIRGGDGVDEIEGDDGDDSIAGEGGHDHVRGDAGNDRFDNNREVEDQQGDQVENQVGDQGDGGIADDKEGPDALLA